jgi:hypothetical protein
MLVQQIIDIQLGSDFGLAYIKAISGQQIDGSIAGDFEGWFVATHYLAITVTPPPNLNPFRSPSWTS